MSVTVRMSAPVVTRFRLGDSVSTLFGATQMHAALTEGLREARMGRDA